MAKLPPELEKILNNEKPAKFQSSFSIDKRLNDEFRDYCRSQKTSASHVVESLIRWYMAQATKSGR